MPMTLIDWANQRHAEFMAQRASLRRFQRVLCKLGIHRWHRTVHEQEMIRRFTALMPELQNLPFKKIGHEYIYDSESEWEYHDPRVHETRAVPILWPMMQTIQKDDDAPRA